LILLTNNFILTLSKRQPDFITEILTKSKGITTTQKYKTLIIFLSRINKEFENETIKTVKIVNALAASTRKIKEKNIYTLLEQEEKLNFYISSYHYKKPIYEKLIKRLNFYEADKDIVEDLIIDSEEGLNLCKSSLKTISNIRNYYDVVMSTRINRTITVLTLFTIFLSVFTAISGFYGMNVALPFQNVPLISIYIFAFSLFLGSVILIFARFKWL
jgi:magnesium transporter